ncbi:hypothetical protein BH23VER1_BH23VER1_09350 [soil metagenome]
MNTSLLKILRYGFAAAALALFPVSCDRDTPQEEAREDMGDAIEDATDDADDATESAGDAIEDATDN